MTHYSPYFTMRSNDSTDRAVCGVYIERAEFSTEPTCETCAAWLIQDALKLSALDDIEFSPVPKKSSPDPVAEYHAHMDRHFPRRVR